MKYPIELNTAAEYEYAKSRGFEPLIDSRFILPFELRREIQKTLFPDLSERTNAKFYRWAWDNSPQVCQETGRPLRSYSAVHISHIITKANRPDMKYDGRNFNILCFDAHRRWDSSGEEERKKMNIYKRNKTTIDELTRDYGG